MCDMALKAQSTQPQYPVLCCVCCDVSCCAVLCWVSRWRQMAAVTSLLRWLMAAQAAASSPHSPGASSRAAAQQDTLGGSIRGRGYRHTHAASLLSDLPVVALSGGLWGGRQQVHLDIDTLGLIDRY